MGKKKVTTTPKNYVYVNIQLTDRTGGEPVNPNEKWTDYEPEYLTHEISDDFQLECKEYREYVQVPDWVDGTETIYGVVITYSSGDTFGYRYGYKSVPVGFVSLDEANKLAEQVSTTKKWDQNKYGHMCWDGYFEQLEGVEVKEIKSKRLFKWKHS